ncbi:MAG: DUF2905 domain-containing protein [Bacillota bacterium]|nr:DUF2905 domain-containing protein [Bacillota bacterium]
MSNLESIGKLLIIGGGIIVATGLVIYLLSRLGLGRLPGDIFIQRENITFYFPLATMLLISIILTILLNIFRR